VAEEAQLTDWVVRAAHLVADATVAEAGPTSFFATPKEFTQVALHSLEAASYAHPRFLSQKMDMAVLQQILA